MARLRDSRREDDEAQPDAHRHFGAYAFNSLHARDCTSRIGPHLITRSSHLAAAQPHHWAASLFADVRGGDAARRFGAALR